jgi:hypothetical protein
LTEGEVASFEERVGCNLGAQAAANPALGEQLLSLSDPFFAYAVAVLRCPDPGTVSRDTLLSEGARAHGIATVGLETPFDVEMQRRAVPAPIYAQLVKVALRAGNDGDMDLAASALNAGRYDEILSIMQSPLSPEAARIFFQHMLDERNENWMARLRPILDDGAAVINVGAGHLAGDKGLIKLLEREGYRVEVINLPTSPVNAPSQAR